MGDQRYRKVSRREWLRRLGRGSAAACGLSFLPASIQRALAIPGSGASGTIEDVDHVVILMQENRSFDHYFGTMAGVRGFGDRTAIPIARGKSVWFQSDGRQDVLPFHLDTKSTSAMRVRGTPHSWVDAHQAWDMGRITQWPRFKKTHSLGYYEVDDIPFQRALASAFTLCDAHHCSIQSGTLANRIVFMTGTNVRPDMTEPARSKHDACIDNGSNRGLKYGHYTWTTYPERLQAAGVRWRIYQDPRDNWDGLLAPWESFEAYAQATSSDPLFEGAMTHWPLASLAQHAADGTLPQVSWIIPPPVWSEHPARSSPLQGAAFTQKVLDALTANPELWSRTALIVSFDENDGFFDHVPPPAPPSFDARGQALGASTLSADAMRTMYFLDERGGETVLRPYGLGPRVPMYIVSPWSQGGWVCSEVFDHTSTIRFLEKRFGVHEPNISAWNRAVSGDLTSCFDFTRPRAHRLFDLPDMSSATGELLVIDLPAAQVPANQQLPKQDEGVRFSRALPYRLNIETTCELQARALRLELQNAGTAGAVFHVYNVLDLQQPPSRYTVEAFKSLTVTWPTSHADGAYDLYICGPNGSCWRFAGELPNARQEVALPELRLHKLPATHELMLEAWNAGTAPCEIMTKPQAYYTDPEATLTLIPFEAPQTLVWTIAAAGFWYDLAITSSADNRWLRRFAGRMETGKHGISDPALGGLPFAC